VLAIGDDFKGAVGAYEAALRCVGGALPEGALECAPGGLATALAAPLHVYVPRLALAARVLYQIGVLSANGDAWREAEATQSRALALLAPLVGVGEGERAVDWQTDWRAAAEWAEGSGHVALRLPQAAARAGGGGGGGGGGGSRRCGWCLRETMRRRAPRA